MSISSSSTAFLAICNMDTIDRKKVSRVLLWGAAILLGGFVIVKVVKVVHRKMYCSDASTSSISHLVANGSTTSLVKLSTSQTFLTDNGLRFCVSMLNSTAPKPERSEQTTDPFLYPFEPGIHICDLGEDYRLLYNKFYVCKGHVLIVSKRFEEQTNPLTRRDFEVMQEVIGDLNAVAFFNSGPESGYSQPHKHIQVIPLEGLPIGLWRDVEEVREDGVFTLPQFNFRHYFFKFTPGAGPDTLFQAYSQLLKLLGISTDQHSYNLILTSRWMLMVLRDKALAFNRISINSLGFLGLILVKTNDDLELVNKTGPLSVIRDTACRL